MPLPRRAGLYCVDRTSRSFFVVRHWLWRRWRGQRTTSRRSFPLPAPTPTTLLTTDLCPLMPSATIAGLPRVSLAYYTCQRPCTRRSAPPRIPALLRCSASTSSYPVLCYTTRSPRKNVTALSLASSVSRLYARNFGGELKLDTMAGEGTNATLRLSRRGTRLEPLVWPKATDSIDDSYSHVHL